MPSTEPGVQINVVANAEREVRLIETANKYGASGYTVWDVRGGGRSGSHTGTLDADRNIFFIMVIDKDHADDMLAALERMMGRGHHLTVWVTDAQTLPRPTSLEE